MPDYFLIEDVEILATRYMMELGYSGRKTEEQYEDIRDAFLVGFKRGNRHWECDQLDWIDEQKEKIAKEHDSIDRRLGSISAQMTRLNKLKAEILELKAALKESFAIKEIK